MSRAVVVAVAVLVASATEALPARASAASAASNGAIQDGVEAPADVREALARLEGARGADFGAALDALRPFGAAATRAALDGFSDVGPDARRARARLLVELHSPSAIEGVLAHLDDPDPEVRRQFATFLGDLALAGARADDRLAALRTFVATDTDHRVRTAALDALRRSLLPGTHVVLDELLSEVDGELAVEVADALVANGTARLRVVARVRAAFGAGAASGASPGTGAAPSAAGARGTGALPPDVLARLLSGYGRALAELPRGGADAADRAPFVLGERHPAREVRIAARSSFDALFGRLFDFGEHARADALLVAFANDGMPRHDLLYRRVKLALTGDGDAARAHALAVEMERAATIVALDETLRYEAFATYLQGAAHFALGDFDSAVERFATTRVLLEELVQQRPDLSADHVLQLGGAIVVDRLQLLALSDLWSALARLASGVRGDDRAVLETLRSAHVGLLHARAVDEETDAPGDAGTFDVLFDRDLGPGPLVLFNRKIARWKDPSAYALFVEFGRALATVAPYDFPGFDPFDVARADGSVPPRLRRLIDPLFDDERRLLLERAREGLLRTFARQFEERLLGGSDVAERDVELAQLNRLIQYVQEKKREEDAAVRAMSPERTREELLDVYRELIALTGRPSLLARTIALQMRNDGDAEGALALARHLLDDLGANWPGAHSRFVEDSSADIELLIGNAYTDLDRPRDAEEIVTRAVRRLEALENMVRGNGTPESHPVVQQLRLRRANALLTLAVNANVKGKDTERALAFFERAYELDQREFMQVLLACYRARSGRVDEARAVLQTIQPSPTTYYNLACTHALLGDADEAIDFLLRDFAENHPTSGSLERQKEWARDDPDLASLRGNERFRRIVGLED